MSPSEFKPTCAGPSFERLSFEISPCFSMSENIQNYFRLALTSESPARHQPKALPADAFASMFLILELGGIG